MFCNERHLQYHKIRMRNVSNKDLNRLEHIQAPRILLIAGSKLQDEQRHDLYFLTDASAVANHIPRTTCTSEIALVTDTPSS